MGELLAALKRLQEIELTMSRFRRAEERKTRQVLAAERKTRQIDDELAERERQRTPLQRDLDQLDLEVKSREASILKHREELLKARTNKDYSAILTAINTEKADSSKIEQLALEKLAQVEKVQEEVNALAAERETVQERLRAAQQAVEDYLGETAEQRGQLEAQRSEAAAAVPSGALATFSRVALRHDGEALAEVARLRPKHEEYACGGCNMKVPLDIANALRARDEIRFCVNCGRILHLPDTQGAGT